MQGKTIGIDTGGTFTDAVHADGTVEKVASRPSDPGEAIAEAAAALRARAGDRLCHGTTVATNATLQGRLAPVGLVLTEGFADLLSIGRQARPELYALQPRRPQLPTSPQLTAVVPGRLAWTGEELEAPDPQALREAGARLLESGAQAFAVVLLHSWARDDHEQAARAALAEFGLPITLSAELNPEFREVERGVAALLNAGLVPIVGPYLQGLLAKLPDLSIQIMSSEGGLLSPARAAAEPARLLLSGPAGGVVAARRWADALGEPLMLTLDMGGTSTDVALIAGDLPRQPSLEIAGHEVRLPSLAIHTVGAGGGSLLGSDRGGALTVGPESAGADPGPAAYGRGERLTVTDAHLLLGHIDPTRFGSGRIPLNLERARAIAQAEADRIGMTPPALLRGMLDIADVSMTRALRRISVERGCDPRAGALFVFGGAGGLHGISLARQMGMRRVLWPREAGVLSARGLVWTDPSRTASRTVLLDSVPPAAERRELVRPLAERLRAEFEAEGFDARAAREMVRFDLRYRGQSYELAVEDDADLEARFHHAHQLRFGFDAPDRPVEMVAVRVQMHLPGSGSAWPALLATRNADAQPVGRCTVPIDSSRTHAIYDFDGMAPGERVKGPAIVAARTGSFWLDAASEGRIHERGALVVEVDA